MSRKSQILGSVVRLGAFVFLALMTSGGWVRAMDLDKWKVDGDVTVDKTQAHTDGGASLKIAPGAKATLNLRKEDGAGKVTLYVYDDMTSADDPKAPRVGPSWGLIQSDGKMLVAGVLYARYLGGDTGYAEGEGAGSFYRKCQGLGGRKQGWHKWEFNFDAQKGLSILLDGKATKFDWNRTDMVGFTGVVLFGDEAVGKKRQTLWVDELATELGGPMQVKPTPPPPPPAILPAKDAPAEKAALQLRDGLAGQHPRLLLNDKKKVDEVREFYKSDQGAIYRQELNDYYARCKIPDDRTFAVATTWGQEYGLFQLPTTALHYVVTGNKDSLAKSVAFLKWLAATADWSKGGEPAVEDTPDAYAKVLAKMMAFGPDSERNSDTTAAFTMVGAALTFDWVYNDLDPAFRESFRQVLWQHARAMYYGGHMALNPGGNYWHGVPMYNHRWFRDWGLALAVLATTEGKPEEQWMLGKVEAELKFMDDWLPADGSIHEGPGYGGSSGALGMAFLAADQCLGSHYLDVPFFRNVGTFAVEEATPGMKEAFYFADCFTKANSLTPLYLNFATYFHEDDVRDALQRHIAASPNGFGIQGYAWTALIYDNAKPAGDYKKLPTTYLFPDLGMAIIRENWNDNVAAAMFKCGPPGGYTLNSWRPTAKNEKGVIPGINVAHDHPDANTFVLLNDGEYLAETDRYCITEKKLPPDIEAKLTSAGYPAMPGKLSSSLNTILINGTGQTPFGRPENEGWLQPSSQDMTKMGVLTAWKDAGDVVVTEGEAAGSYLVYKDKAANKERPALDRFRRTFIWVKGGYVLVLDDIRAPKAVDVTWLMQGQKLTPVDEAKGQYQLAKNKAQCDFQLLADVPFKAVIGLSTANDHGKNLGWQQLQATAGSTKTVRFVSVYDLWHHGNLKLDFTPAADGKATIKVSGGNINDTWDWQAAAGQFEASTLHGTRQGGFDVTVDAQTAKPPAVPPAQ